MRARPRTFIRERRLAASFLRRKLLGFREIGVLLGVKAWQASALARAADEELRRPA
jgi:hypothetical protein